MNDNTNIVTSVINDDTQALIFKCSWYESRRHRISHTDMFFEELRDTLWVWHQILVPNEMRKVEVIKVSKDSDEYRMAIESSSRRREKRNPLVYLKENGKFVKRKISLVCGVECNKCGNMVPPHTREVHLDATNPIHICPHPLENVVHLNLQLRGDKPDNPISPPKE